jgi:hypothetical protein
MSSADGKGSDPCERPMGHLVAKPRRQLSKRAEFLVMTRIHFTHTVLRKTLFTISETQAHHGLLSSTMRDASTCYEKNVHGKHPLRGGNSRLSDVRAVYPIVPIIVTCDLHLHKLMIDSL